MKKNYEYYIKQYNKKAKKSKKNLVLIDLDSVKTLSSSDKAKYTKLLKNVDLRKQTYVIGKQYKINLDILRLEEQIVEKKEQKFKKKTEVQKVKLRGVEIAEQEKEEEKQIKRNFKNYIIIPIKL